MVQAPDWNPNLPWYASAGSQRTEVDADGEGLTEEACHPGWGEEGLGQREEGEGKKNEMWHRKTDTGLSLDQRALTGEENAQATPGRGSKDNMSGRESLLFE